MFLHSINPANAKDIHSYPCMNQVSVAQAIQGNYLAFLNWRQCKLEYKVKLFASLINVMQSRRDTLAMLITQEMGKPITQSLAEVDKCISLCNYYIQNVHKYLQDDLISTKHSKSYRCIEPLGIILAIMPWNFPLWQVMRFAVPNLLLGNAGLLKHAPNVTGCALAIEELFKLAGFPENIFRSLVIDIEQIPNIIQDNRICGVTITGSARAGQIVAQQAGKCLKKVVLELGGSDPYIILDDANIDLAVEQCLLSRLNNAGQVCIAAKRIIVTAAIHDDFVSIIKQKMHKYQMKDPTDPTSLLGPMARDDLRQQFHIQVESVINEGAKCLMGGTMPTASGFYYPATLLTNINENSIIFKEELFGPAVAIIKVNDENEAIRLANKSDFGLGAAVFTQDLVKGEYIAKYKLEAGTCAVNTLVASDPSLPFGGIKQSGFGRELALEGMREFANIKTIIIN